MLLACLRSMLTHASRRRNLASSRAVLKVNLVVMSATFDRDKYQRYFAGLPDAGAHVVVIPAPGAFGGGLLAGMGGAPLPRVQSHYLEYAVRLVNDAEGSGSRGAAGG